MKVLVIGKHGQLGKSINKVITNTKQENEYIFTGTEDLDLSKEININSYFNDNKFDAIVNCAAYTNVDKAAEDIVFANQINNLAVAQLSSIAKKQKSKLIQISTDYVFDGKSNKPYTENDPVNPINAYGKTKLAGEQAILKEMSNNAIIIRTSWLYSEFGNNFVNTMLKLGKERDELSIVNDQIGSPTCATDLASVILFIIQSKHFFKKNQETQIYHYSNAGNCTWYEFAEEIFKLTSIKCNLSSISTEQYLTQAKRPRNTAMNKDKISKAFKINNFNWKDSLKRCLLLYKVHSEKT